MLPDAPYQERDPSSTACDGTRSKFLYLPAGKNTGRWQRINMKGKPKSNSFLRHRYSWVTYGE